MESCSHLEQVNADTEANTKGVKSVKKLVMRSSTPS
jgi:hypothetical protein